jgi:hypothetical protein
MQQLPIRLMGEANQTIQLNNLGAASIEDTYLVTTVIYSWLVLLLYQHQYVFNHKQAR